MFSEKQEAKKVQGSEEDRQARKDQQLKQKKQIAIDEKAIRTMLRDMGIREYEPDVVSRLLTTAYGYVASVIQEAEEISAYGRKKVIDVKDVGLAIRIQGDKYNFPKWPSHKEVLAHARKINQVPLPTINPFGNKLYTVPSPSNFEEVAMNLEEKDSVEEEPRYCIVPSSRIIDSPEPGAPPRIPKLILKKVVEKVKRIK